MRNLGGVRVAFDDIGRRALLQKQPEPNPCGEFRMANLGERRHVGQERVAARTGDRENP
jgi:hypothetical protein